MNVASHKSENKRSSQNCERTSKFIETPDFRPAFVLSQPRAGSTFVQRVLNNAPDVFTASEPWIMLPLIFALEGDLPNAPYNAFTCRAALKHFLSTSDGGESDYWNACRQMALDLYSRQRTSETQRVFIDKTPRYYYISDSLRRVFPDSPIIVLLRHPVAVLFSILDTWGRPEPGGLMKWSCDIVDAPDLLIDATRSSRDVKTIHYERLVEDPAGGFRDLFGGLGLAFDPGYLLLSNAETPQFGFGDPVNAHRLTKADAGRARLWCTKLVQPQYWRLARDYCDLLGDGRLDALGYDPRELHKLLRDTHPSGHALLRTVGLEAMLAPKRRSIYARVRRRLLECKRPAARLATRRRK